MKIKALFTRKKVLRGESCEEVNVSYEGEFIR